MEIQVRTDHHVKGEQALVEFVQDVVAAGLDPYLERLTGVQVHLSEESGARKGPPELRCMIEVRPQGGAPLAVTHQASTKDAAVRGAAEDMHGVLERTLGRVDDRRRTRETIRRPS